MNWNTQDVNLDFGTESNFSSQWGEVVTEENESKDSFAALPEGEYDFFVKEVDEVLGKNPASKYYGKPMIKIRFLVENRSIWLYIFDPKDWKIRNIAESLKLSSAKGEAILEEAEGKTGRFYLKVRKNKDGEEENVISKFI